MPATLAQTIAECIREGRYLIGLHASERLEERGIMEWQVIEAMAHCALVRESPDAVPNPSAVFEIILPDGSPATAVWAHLRKSNAAKLVTVF